ncbi:unnamed protein product [Arctia plantaginis]|uniref:Uncharacterized protein n=1 Tax=Arctia plantaginis TaxID=874455 RepID=A0A8S1BIC0_ARCPL|nr:unnamed protein product [Arctia plantaginis]
MFDDENDDDECGGQSRYPVMPSLVALQQMKNRLHLAYLGKKLMKWTTLATVKELRKLALEMTEYFVGYGDDFARAFMLLARSRYYYPNLNTIVVQNVGNEAACRVETDYRSVAGVKLLALNVIEETFDPNEHLGIEKGGTAISDAKKAWRDLLKLVVLMLQERKAFDALHAAHNAANKKQNVLGKLVIPRIQNAIAYIKSELEEQEREETFRLKRFKQSKEKKTRLIKEKDKKDAITEEPVFTCPVCLPKAEIPKEVQVKKEPSIKEEPIIKGEPNIIVKKESKFCGCTDPRPELDQSTGKFICPICNLADRNVDINVVACKVCLPEVNEVKERADHLMAHINQVLTLSRFYNKTLSGMDTKESDLSYADIKKALENINSICTCPHMEKQKIEEAKPCGCAICASKDIKSEQKETVDFDKKTTAIDKKPDAPCMTEPSGGGLKDIKPEQTVNDCCKNKLQAIVKKTDAPCLSESSGDGSKGIKPEQNVNDCCKNKPQAIDKKPDAPILPEPTRCPMCGSKDIKSEQKVNDCGCNKKPQAMDKKPDAPCLSQPSGCPMCGSKDVKSEQKVNDCGCNNKPQAMDEKPDAPCLSKPSGCPMCGSKDVKSEQKVNDCGCNNKPQAMDEKPDAPCLSKPSGCPMCGSKDVKSEQKVNDCGCNNKPQTMDKKPDAPILPKPSGCPMCGSKDIKSEQKVNDCGCNNKPQALDKKPDAPCLSKPSGCPMCGSKDIKSEQKVNDCCKNKPQAIEKKPDAPILPEPSGCLMCGSKGIKPEQKVNDCGCNNKPQAMDKKPDAPCLLKPSGCPMCGSKDIKSEQKVNDCCKNKPQAIEKKPDAPILPEPSGCLLCGSKGIKPEPKVNDCCKNKPQTIDKKPDAPCLSKPAGCPMCGSKDIKSEQKVNDYCKNKPQAIEKKPDAPILPEPSGCLMCGSKGIKPEQKVNDCCKNKPQTMDKKPDAPCLSKPSGCPMCGSKDIKSEQKVNDCGCNNKPQMMDKKPDAPCLSKPSGCPMCGSKDIKPEQKVNDCCKNKPQTMDNKPDAPCLSKPAGCPMCGSKDIKSEQKVNDCGCNNKPQTMDKKPDAPSLSKPSGCLMCGSKDIKSEQKVNDCCKNKPQAIDKKPDAPILPEPSGCPMCGSKDVKSEQKVNDCGCNNKPQTMDKKPDAPILPEPSGCPMCGSKDIKSEQKVNDCGCNIEPKATDKKPKAPCLTVNISEQKSEDCCISKSLEKKSVSKSDACCQHSQDTAEYTSIEEMEGLCSCTNISDSAKEKSCCDMAGISKSDYQTYNLCSISAIKSGSCFQSVSNLYQPAPPFFYLYSGPYVHSQTGLHPICNGNMIPQINTISKKCLCSNAPYPGEFKQDNPICTCKSTNNLPSQQPSKELCTCESIEAMSPLTLSLHSLQVDPINMTCKNIFQSYPPTASLPTANLPLMLAKRVAKASEPYLKKSCLKNGDYPYRERCEDPTIEFKCPSNNSIQYPPTATLPPTNLPLTLKNRIAKASEPYLKKTRLENDDYPVRERCDDPTIAFECLSNNSKQSKQNMLCSCKSIQQQTSFSCNSCSTLYSGNLTTNSLSQEMTKPPYFKKSTTHFTDIPQGFLPLLSHTVEETSNTVILSSTSISSDTAYLHSTKENLGTEIKNPLNKFTPKQFMCFSPYTRDGKSRSCDVSERSLIISSYDTTQSDYHGTDETPGCCIFSKEKCITDSLHDIVQKQSPFFSSHTHVVNPRLCSISSTNLCDSPDPQSSRLLSSTLRGVSGTQSISIILDCILFKQCKSSTTQNNSIQKASSTPSTYTKDFSIYTTMTPHDNSPYKRRLDKPGPCNTFETSSETKPSTFKDCSTFVTVAPKKVTSYTCEGRSFGVSEAVNRTEFFKEITQNCCEFTLFNKNENCIAFTPYTREGKPGPCGLTLKCDAFSKNNTPNSRKDRSGTYSVQCNTNKETVFSPSFTCNSRSKICGCEKNNMPLSWSSTNSVRLDFTREETTGRTWRISETNIPACSETHTDFQQCTNARPVPYIRERIPGPSGPCEVDNTKGSVGNISTDQLTKPVTCTREGRPGLSDISKTSYNIKSQQSTYQAPYISGISEITVNSITLTCSGQGKQGTCDIDLNQCQQVIPNTREGLSGPCDVSETSYIASSQNKTALLQPTSIAPYTREGMPGPCGLSMTNDNARQFTKPAPFTREGRAGPYDISKTNNNVRQFTDPAPYTREGRAGPYDISKRNDNVRQFTDPVPYTREGRAGRCDISKTNDNVRQLTDPAPYTREGRAGPCDISKTNDNVRQLTDPAPYTREGRAGPCDISKTNDNVRQLTDPAPYTREGRAGPCDISKTNDNVRQFTEPAPYTREGRAGPCDISKTNDNVRQFTGTTPYTREGKAGPCDISKTNNNIRQPTDPAPFTREGREGTTTAVSHINPDPRQLACQGRIGPCDILGTNNTASFLSKITTIHSSNFASNILQHREPCNVCVKNNITCSLCAMDPSESTNLLSFTRDGNPEACGVSKTNPTASSFYNTALKHYSHNTPYTREGMPGVCGVNKTNFANSQNKHTHQSAYIEPYTREGKPGPCGLSLHNSESPLEEILSRQYTAPGPFTREGKEGPCDISNINYTTNLLNKIDPKQSTHIASHALIKNPEPCSVCERKHFICSKCARDSSSSRNLASCATKGIYGPCGVSEFNNVARSICNLVLKKSTSVTLSKQEGTLGLSETKHIICSCNNNDSIGSKNLQTCIRKDGHEPCSVTMSSVIFNTSSKQCTRLTSFTRESKPGPCGAFETNRITVSNCFELMNEPNTNQSRNFSPFIRVDMPESCSFSERKNILNSLYDRTSKPCAHILPCTGSNKPQICSECERNGIACPLCIIDLKESTNSAPYTREGIPGPCGVSEAKNNISSLGNWEFQILKPYTREGVPGPCGISEKGLTFPHYKLYASYACQLKPGPWNILECPNATGSTKLITSVRKPCNSKPPSKLGQRQSSDKNEFNLCDTQSCLMYQVHTPCGTYHRNGIQFSATSATKDATTYVTVGPCPVQNIREATLRNCSTCDRKITFDTSTPHSTRNYKVRAPHTCMNVTRSLIAIPRFVCSSCRPYAKASAAPVMILPSHVLSMASSFAPSRTCCCKSQISSVLTLKSGHNCDESLYSVGSNKFCSTCGRPASNKANLKTNSAPLLKYVTYANCENCAPSHVSKFEPCADCRNTKLFLSCASNPSIKSVAIGTCASRNHCTSSKAARLPKSAVQTPCPLSQNTAAIISCPTCSKKRREKCVPHASASKQSCSSLVSKDSKAVIDESKFGYFEIGKKKVTKIYRCKNPDGTITDEKRVIIIKTEKKYPEKLESSGFEAGTISDCLKNETNKKRNTNEMDVPKFSRQSKSDTCCNGTNDRMTYPQIRYCISTQDCNNMTVNNNCLEPNHDSSKNSNRFVTAHSIPTGLVCANRLEDTDSGPKCGCENKPPSKYTTLASRARPVAPTPLRYNGLKDTANSQTCDYPDKLRTKPSASVEPTIPACANRLQDSDSGPRCNCADKSLPDITTPVQPTTPVCANRLQDTDSGPKCDCANKSPPLPATLEQLATPVCANRLEDSDSGPKCDCAIKSTPTPVCANRLQDTDSGPKCDCANKSPPLPATVDQPPTPVCANRLQDTDSGPKCDCANKSPPLPATVDQPSTPVCANRLQDTDSGPKCDCANKSPPLPATLEQLATPVCANRLEDSDSGPKCDCAIKSTPTPVCANRLQDTDSGPKCDCANKSPPLPATVDQPPTPVCANRLQDTDSGPKCDCANKSPPLPATVDQPSTPVCANRLQDTDSGPKCDCANKSPPLPATLDQLATPVCANRLEDSDSGPKCDCASKSTPKPINPVCANRLQDSDSGPSCNCADKSLSENTTPIQLTTSVCANRLQDSDSGPKCDCANKSTPKPLTPVCANRLQDTDSGPKCDCANKSNLKPLSPVCVNREYDTDSGPKCNCANKSPLLPVTVDQPTTPVCANRLEDSDSGPKCDCANKSSPSPITVDQPTTPVCANRLEDSDSGPKCDCASKATPKPTTVDQPITPICANRLEDTDSGPKCHCANKSCPLPITVDPPTTPVCANRLEDSDSGPKCDCANKSSPSPITVDQPTTPVCANRLEDSDSGPKCDCARKATPKPTTVDQPTTTVCANRLEDTDSGPKCSCANKSPPLHTTKDRPTNPVCANRLEDSDSGPKCDCASKSAPKPTTPVFANIRLQDSHSGHICHCANKSHFLPATIDKPTCGHTLQHSDNTLKCDCARKLTCKHTKPSSKQSQTMIHPPKCSCDNESSPTPTCPFHKPLNPCQCKVTDELLPSTKSQDKEVCCSLQKKIGIMKHISDAQENKVKDDREFDYVYIVPSKKTICNKVLKSDVPCSTTNLACCTPKLSYDANVPTSPKKIVPKTYKNRCCSTSDTGKLSIFRGGSMLDALRQLFQSSNSRTQNRKTFDKNICKTCYSPLSNTDDGESLNTPLCTSCKEKIIDESEQDYRLTNYSTETGSPASKKSPSPFGQMSFLSTSSCNINVDHSCPAMVSTVISTDSNDSLMCMRGENYFRNANRNDAATSTRVRDETYMRAIKKGKIEHACVPDVKDCASHTTN